ncbi:hypothetical protein T484DRAFT_1625146, partial [Baffinella frigidus]
PQPSTLNPQPSTLNPQPSTRNPQPANFNPQPSTLNPQPSTLNPTPSILNPQQVAEPHWAQEDDSEGGRSYPALQNPIPYTLDLRWQPFTPGACLINSSLSRRL